MNDVNSGEDPINQEQGSSSSLSSETVKQPDQSLEYGDNKYVCFKIKNLEFFTSAANYAKHSRYFNKVHQNQQQALLDQQENIQPDAEGLKQFVVHLSKGTLPSVLHLMIQFLDAKVVLDSSIEPFTLYQLAQVADELKLRAVEAELLNKIIVQMLHKMNIIDYLNVAFQKVESKKKQYRQELVPEENSDSDEEEEQDKRKKRMGRDSSDSDSSSDDYDDVGDDSEVSEKKEPKMIQVELPNDQNDNIEEIKDSEQTWKEFLNYCIDLAACNLQYIMFMRQEDFASNVYPEVIEQIVSKNMQFYRGNPNHDNRSLIQLLMRVRQCRSVFELLKLEKEKIFVEEALARAQQANANTDREPLLVWSVSNLTNYFYKQSDSIHIQGAHWRLALSYFKKQSTCLKVEIKIMNSPFDIKQAKEYYKKHEFGVPANLDVQKIDPMAQFEVEEVDIEVQQQRVNQLNAAAANFTNHAFVSFIASVDLFDGAAPSKAGIHSMICSQKSPVQLLAVENFDITKVEGDAINVSLQFHIKELHAQLLMYISKNFTFLMSEPEIRHLTKDDLKLILRHKHLNVTQEDEVLKAICLWLEGQTMMLKLPRYANVPKQSLLEYAVGADVNADQFLRDENQDKHPNEGKRDLVADLNEVLLNVNWDYVTLPCMLDVLRSEPAIRKCHAFQQAIKNQFGVRMNKDSQEAIDAAHSQFNNEPRFSYKYNTSQRCLYPTEADLSFQNRAPVLATHGTKSQFHLLYPVQIYPDFMQHLIDCMINPIDIVKNWNGSQLLSVGPAMSPDAELLRRQQEVRQRTLKQQLMNKQLEMKQIQDQLDAIEILDKLMAKPDLNQNAEMNKNVHFSELDDKIEQAKRAFKIRIDEKRGAQDSARNYLNDRPNNAEEEHIRLPQEVSGVDSDDDNPEIDEADLNEESKGDEQSVEEFNVEQQDGSPEVKHVPQAAPVQNVEEEKEDMEAEWDRINEESELKSIRKQQNLEESKDSAFEQKEHLSSCEDYANLKVERKGWSNLGSQLSSEDSAQFTFQKSDGQGEVVVVQDSHPMEKSPIHRAPGSMQMSVGGASDLKYNQSISSSGREYKSSESSQNSGFVNPYNPASHSPARQLQKEVKTQEKEIQTVTEAAVPIDNQDMQSQTELDLVFMGYLLEQLNDKKAIEDELQKAKAKIEELLNVEKASIETQTEVAKTNDAAVGTENVRPVELVQQQLNPIEIIQETKPVLIIEIPKKQPISKLTHQIVVPAEFDQEILEEIKETRPQIEDSAVDDLNQNSSFFKSENSVSSDQSGSKQDDRKKDTDSKSVSESSSSSEESPSAYQESERVSIQIDDIQQSDGSGSLNINTGIKTPTKKMTTQTVDELINGQNQIKSLTIDIFANIGSEIKDGSTSQISSVLDNMSKSKLSADKFDPVFEAQDVQCPAESLVQELDPSLLQPTEDSIVPVFYAEPFNQAIPHSQQNHVVSVQERISTKSPSASVISESEDSNCEQQVPVLEPSGAPELITKQSSVQEHEPLQSYLNNHQFIFPATTKAKGAKRISQRPKSGFQTNRPNFADILPLQKTKTPTNRRKTPVQMTRKPLQAGKGKALRQPEKFVPPFGHYDSKQMSRAVAQRARLIAAPQNPKTQRFEPSSNQIKSGRIQIHANNAATAVTRDCLIGPQTGKKTQVTAYGLQPSLEAAGKRSFAPLSKFLNRGSRQQPQMMTKQPQQRDKTRSSSRNQGKQFFKTNVPKPIEKLEMITKPELAEVQVGLEIETKNSLPFKPQPLQLQFSEEMKVQQPQDRIDLVQKLQYTPQRDRHQSNANVDGSKLLTGLIKEHDFLRPKNSQQLPFSHGQGTMEILESDNSNDISKGTEEVEEQKVTKTIDLNQLMQGMITSDNRIVAANLLKAPSNKTVSDKSALLSVAYQGEMFSNRDEGLACFNILDHLRDQRQSEMQSASEESASVSDSGPSSTIHSNKPVLDLKQLREEHIKKSVIKR